jgi:hypothetical protein
MIGYNINMVDKKLHKTFFWWTNFKTGKVNLGGDEISIRVDEPNRSKGNPIFSWDNHCQGAEKIMKRLDTIYVSKASFIGRIVGLCDVWWGGVGWG